MNRPELRFGDTLRRWRRLRGQTQSDVAARSGYSQRHISFLESSRSMPTRESVLVLAETLDVPVHARNELLLAAGFAPSYSAHALDSENLAAAVEALRSVLASSRPFPAMLIDRTWNVYAVNPNMRALLERLVREPAILAGPGPLNALELCLAHDGLRTAIANWPAFGRTFMNLVRRDLSYDPGNEALRAWLERLEQDGTLATRSGGRGHEPVSVLELRQDTLSVKLFTIVSAFEEPLDATLSDLRIETFFPADEATRAILEDIDMRLRDSAPAAPDCA